MLISEKDIIKLVCERINVYLDKIHPSFYKFDKNKEYIDLIILSVLVDELLEIKEYSDGFIEILDEFGNGKMIVDTFKMIRNTIIHFPLWEKWEDVKISNDILAWKKPKGSFIKKYFNEYNYDKIGTALKFEFSMMKKVTYYIQ